MTLETSTRRSQGRPSELAPAAGTRTAPSAAAGAEAARPRDAAEGARSRSSFSPAELSLVQDVDGLEALRGDRKGQHSMRVNQRWRVCFVWRDGDAHDVEIVDYH